MANADEPHMAAASPQTEDGAATMASLESLRAQSRLATHGHSRTLAHNAVPESHAGNFAPGHTPVHSSGPLAGLRRTSNAADLTMMQLFREGGDTPSTHTVTKVVAGRRVSVRVSAAALAENSAGRASVADKASITLPEGSLASFPDASVHGERVSVGPAPSPISSASGPIASTSTKAVEDAASGLVIEEENEARCLLKPNGPFLRRWDTLLLLVLLFTAIVTPFEVSFLPSHDVSHLDLAHLDAFFIINLVIELLFAIDMGVHFVTPFMDVHTNEEVVDHRKIAVHYLRGTFFLDLVTVIPFDLFVGAKDGATLRLIRFARLMKLAKILRALHANRLIDRLKVRFGVSTSSISLGTFLVLMVLEAHWMACLWHLTALLQSEETVTWLSELQQYDSTPFERYSASLQWSASVISLVGQSDYVPVNPAERFVSIICVVIAASTYAMIVGYTAGILARSDESGQQVSAERDDLNVYMKENAIDPALRIRVREFFDYCSAVFKQDLRNVRTLRHLSVPLRGELSMHHLGSWFKRVPWITGAPMEEQKDFAAAIIMHMRPQAFGPLEVIARETHAGERLFVITKGLAVVGAAERLLSTHDWFGDAVLLTQRPYGVALRSITYVFALTLSREALWTTLDSQNFPNIRYAARKTMIRLALRREFLNAAKMSKLHRSYLQQLMSLSGSDHAEITEAEDTKALTLSAKTEGAMSGLRRRLSRAGSKMFQVVSRRSPSPDSRAEAVIGNGTSRIARMVHRVGSRAGSAMTRVASRLRWPSGHIGGAATDSAAVTTRLEDTRRRPDERNLTDGDMIHPVEHAEAPGVGMPPDAADALPGSTSSPMHGGFRPVIARHSAAARQGPSDAAARYVPPAAHGAFADARAGKDYHASPVTTTTGRTRGGHHGVSCASIPPSARSALTVQSATRLFDHATDAPGRSPPFGMAVEPDPGHGSSASYQQATDRSDGSIYHPSEPIMQVSPSASNVFAFPGQSGAASNPVALPAVQPTTRENADADLGLDPVAVSAYVTGIVSPQHAGATGSELAPDSVALNPLQEQDVGDRARPGGAERHNFRSVSAGHAKISRAGLFGGLLKAPTWMARSTVPHAPPMQLTAVGEEDNEDGASTTRSGVASPSNARLAHAGSAARRAFSFAGNTSLDARGSVCSVREARMDESAPSVIPEHGAIPRPRAQSVDTYQRGQAGIRVPSTHVPRSNSVHADVESDAMLMPQLFNTLLSQPAAGPDPAGDVGTPADALMPVSPLRRRSIPLDLSSVPDAGHARVPPHSSGVTPGASATPQHTAAVEGRPPHHHGALTAKSTPGRTARPVDPRSVVELESMLTRMPLMARIMSRAKLAERLDAETAAALSGVGSMTARAATTTRSTRSPGGSESNRSKPAGVPSPTVRSRALSDDTEATGVTPDDATVSSRLRHALHEALGIQPADASATINHAVSEAAIALQKHLSGERSAGAAEATPIPIAIAPVQAGSHGDPLAAQVAALSQEVRCLRDAIAVQSQQMAALIQRISAK